MKEEKMYDTLVLNLFAGPGTGKSTLMAQIYSQLKILGIEAEMAPEFAKEKVWEESLKVLDDQIYVFGKQLHKMNRLMGKVEVVICDSPLLFSIVYDQTGNETFAKLVAQQHGGFKNLNFWINRSTTYVPQGRNQTEEEAKELDKVIREVLEKYDGNYEVVEKDQAIFKIVSEVLSLLRGQ